jgi:phosphate transport system substrate-binding protein
MNTNSIFQVFRRPVLRQYCFGLLACCLAFSAARAQTITLRMGSTGSAAPLIRILFEEFRKQNPDATLDLVSPPLGTGGALRALAAGGIDMAVAGRPLKREELARYGRQFDFAATPFVFASAEPLEHESLTLDRVAAIYRGETQRWPSGRPVRVILRSTFESDTLEMCAMSPAMGVAVGAAAQRPGMAVGKDDLDTLNLLSRTPGSFGPTTLGLLATANAHLTVFPIDGVAPSVASLRANRYPWRKTLTAVLPVNASRLALRFAEFLRSPRAAQVLLHQDYLPLAEDSQ